MTIQELADRAGVTTRTIRYYVEEGVLPPPERGRPAEYTEEHVTLLDIIRRLKEQYLPLEEIRDTLQRLGPEQVEEFLGRSRLQQQQARPQGSAADYITQVLDRGTLLTQLKEQTMPPTPAPLPAAQPPPPSAQASSSPMPIRRSAVTGAEDSNNASISEESAPMSAIEQRPDPDTSEERTWQRVALAPGVELHYELAHANADRSTIRKIIEAARTVLGTRPEKGTETQK